MIIQNLINKTLNKNVITIELIPWFHSYNYQVAHDVIDYLKIQNNNVIVALEITRGQLDVISNEINKGNGNVENILNNILAKYDFVNNYNEGVDTFKALFYIVFTCLKQNIKIIPLEDDNLFNQINTKIKNLSPVDSVMCVIQNMSINCNYWCRPYFRY